MPPCSTESPCQASLMVVQQAIICTWSGETQSQSILLDLFGKQIPLSSPPQNRVSENWYYTRLCVDAVQSGEFYP